MNKIVLDKEYYSLKNEELDVIITKKNITLVVDGDVKINDLSSNEDINLKIVLNDNAKLIYNKFNQDLSLENVEIEVNNNTILDFNQSVYNTLSGNYKIYANILGNDNKTNINFYGVTNEKGNLYVDANAKVKENVANNDMLENVRILALNDEENTILPNLLVSSDEVAINHNATISGVNEDYLFYLNSKGLSNEEATKLIVKGFLMNKLDIDEEEKENIF